MKIAITSQGAANESQIDQRFGRAKYFCIYDDQNGTWETVDNVQNFEAAHGAGVQSASLVANKECKIVITGHCGPKAFRTLTAAGIEVYLCDSGSVLEALDKFMKKELAKADASNAQSHWQ